MSYASCVQENLAGRAGCRLPWDTHSTQARPVCATMPQYRVFAEAFEVLKDASMRDIKNMTGCIKPCSYKKYMVVQGPIASTYAAPKYHLSVELLMITTEVTVETEVLLYTWQDLIANFGGTLSLFLGVSFMTLWDGVAKLQQVGTMAQNYFA